METNEMRRIVFAVTMLAALAGTGFTPGLDAQQAGLKIGYINSEAILQSAPGAQDARERVNEAMEGYRTEIQQMAQELEERIREYERQELTLSTEAKEQRQQTIREQQQRYQQRVQQLDQEAGRRQQELIQPLMDEINRVIETLREQGDYSLILDVSAGAIISADPDLDLTDEVLRRLRADATAGG